jgi:hypothetical protein
MARPVPLKRLVGCIPIAFDQPNIVEGFYPFTIPQLKEAFEWTVAHFAELDLGKNLAWMGFTSDTLKLIKNGNSKNPLAQAKLRQRSC